MHLFFLFDIIQFLKLFEYYLSALVKLDLLGVEKDKELLYKKSQINSSNDFICKWISFISKFSSHIGVYLVILLQFQRYLAVKKNTSFNLLLYNHALTKFICVAIILMFLIIDEFYLFKNYYITIIYCPLTMVFTCVINDKFRLLESIKFNTHFYHHIHTFAYNLLPLVFIIIINTMVWIGIKRRKVEKRMIDEENRKRKRSISQTITISNSSVRCSISLHPDQNVTNLKNSFSKRKRLSSTNSTNGYFVRRPKKREVLVCRVNEIFLHHTDVNYLSIIVSFFQILNTFPINLISYLTDWNANTLEQLTQHKNSTSSSMASPLLGEKKYKTQADLYLFYILFGPIEMLNFTLFLVFQIYSCKSLNKELKSFYSFLKCYNFRKDRNIARRHSLANKQLKINSNV